LSGRLALRGRRAARSTAALGRSPGQLV
jgi:hypothetical protein